MADPPEPSLKAPDPFPPWPSDDMPEIKDWAREMLTRCGSAGVVALDSPGVGELLNLLDRHPLAPGPVLAHAEGMLAETGRYANVTAQSWPHTVEVGHHAFWYTLVAALLHRRCLGRWPELPLIFREFQNSVAHLRWAARAALAAAGVIPDEGGAGGPA